MLKSSLLTYEWWSENDLLDFQKALVVLGWFLLQEYYFNKGGGGGALGGIESWVTSG